MPASWIYFCPGIGPSSGIAWPLLTPALFGGDSRRQRPVKRLMVLMLLNLNLRRM